MSIRYMTPEQNAEQFSVVKKYETIEQKQARQQAALCRFAGACERITIQVKSKIYSPADGIKSIRQELKRLNTEMEWEELC